MNANSEKQEVLDKRYLRMAQIWAENSYCQRRKVGAILVKDKMIISDGYNGTPAGFENVCEDAAGATKSYTLPHRPVWNVPNSSSSRASDGWYSTISTVSATE